jgi:putative AdoMet-dependent methyltransferase
VDVSVEMLRLARAKLGDAVELVQSDLLELFDAPDTFDVVVSTYAIHHLTSDEKDALLARARSRLRAGGRLVVGDLMVASAAAVPALSARLRHDDVDAFFVEEFPWEVDTTVRALDRHGFRRIAVEQLSDLSWGVAALTP